MSDTPAFIRFQKFAHNAASLRHLQHVFREKYSEQKIKKAEFISFADSKDDVATNFAKSKKTKNLFLEILVSMINQEQAKQILDLLRVHFKNHKIAAVMHFDESKPHCHFIVSWASVYGKCMRLSKQDLTVHGLLARSISKITQHQITPRGQGRKRLSLKLFNVNEELARSIIQQQQEKDSTALKYLDQMLAIYRVPLAVFALDRNQKKMLHLQTVTDIKQVNLKMLRALENRNNDILFAPVYSDNKVYTLFLDDVPVSRLDLLPGGSIVVQTSRFKYQVHIPLSDTLDINTASLLQKKLARYYESDIAATALQQKRRIVAFKNTKYDDGFTVKVAKTVSSNRIKLNDILQQIYKLELQQQQIKQQQKITTLQVSTEKKKLAHKTWRDFITDESNIDESVVDMRYAIYLLANGFTKEEVYNKLLTESEDLLIRKRNYTHDYLARTIEKAQNYITQLISMKR